MLATLLEYGFIIVGLFFYPDQLVQFDGNILPYLVRRIAWFELWFFGMQLIKILRRWVILLLARKYLTSSQPPYPQYGFATFAVFATMPMFVLISFDLYGQIPPYAWIESFMLFLFISISVMAFIISYRALAIMKYIDGILVNVSYSSSYIDDFLSRAGAIRTSLGSMPVLISVIITLSLIYLTHLFLLKSLVR